ncbi:MAG TPA: M28 family peptidase [Gaiellaceae bacterium]|nr:M28 family peptidase [Gaiellaceae bacterium]
MRRLSLVLLLACTAFALSATAASAGFNGMAAKRWATKIAAVGPRPSGGANEKAAGHIVRARLKQLGYDVSTQHVPLPEGTRSLNVVGRTPGPPRVVLVAHMDGVPGTRAANDNGSGVGLMLMLAQYLRNEDGVLVAAVGAEERRYTGAGYHLGSRRLARSLTPAQRQGIRLALSLDMVAVGPTLNIRGLESSPNSSARRFLAAARRLGIRASYLQDTGQSDHDEFVAVGVPAAWVQWRWDDCWHEPCDRPHRLQGPKLGAAGHIVRRAAMNALG